MKVGEIKLHSSHLGELYEIIKIGGAITSDNTVMGKSLILKVKNDYYGKILEFHIVDDELGNDVLINMESAKKYKDYQKKLKADKEKAKEDAKKKIIENQKIVVSKVEEDEEEF